MAPVTSAFLNEQLELGDELQAGRSQMNDPQDLPGRYGRVVKAVDHVLEAMNCEAVVAGGWAVWHHGYVARLTQDVDIALPADRVQEFLRVASVSGFEILPSVPGRWPKAVHKETQVKVDILPEGARPGTASDPAPTTIPAPTIMGATGPRLRYVNLESLLELKVAAGRARDEADVVELLRAHPDKIASLRQHLERTHPLYATKFDVLVLKAQKQEDV